MNSISLISGATTISILHALLPDHWLAFILVGSSRGWSGNKIMKIAFLAGCGHVAMTSVLGLVVATIDEELFHKQVLLRLTFQVAS
ncbi:MAG: hypothetical protein QXY75_05415 [Candidatus Bathyarchaeia archaeon]